MTKNLSTRQIEAISEIIHFNMYNALAYEAAEPTDHPWITDPRGQARSINEDSGWTFDLAPASGSHARADTWIRHEAVHLSGEELNEAIDIALRRLRDPDDLPF